MSLDFSIYLILPAALWPLGRLKPLTEMSTRNLPGGKVGPAGKADNLTAICEPTVYRKYGNLDVSQPYGPSRPVTGIDLRFLFTKEEDRFYVANVQVRTEETYNAYPLFNGGPDSGHCYSVLSRLKRKVKDNFPTNAVLGNFC
jgi:hypothetical protein